MERPLAMMFQILYEPEYGTIRGIPFIEGNIARGDLITSGPDVDRDTLAEIVDALLSMFHRKGLGPSEFYNLMSDQQRTERLKLDIAITVSINSRKQSTYIYWMKSGLLASNCPSIDKESIVDLIGQVIGLKCEE